MQSLMDKFVKGLPVGAQVEKSFFKIADSLAAIKDPAERARAAQEAFGKSGMDMVRIAGNGSAALKDLAKNYTVLSEAELKQADDAKQNIEDLESSITIYTGKAIAKLGEVSAWWGKVTSDRGMSLKEIWREAGDDYWKKYIPVVDFEGVNKRREAARFARSKKWEEYQKALADWRERRTELLRKADEKANKERLAAAERLRKVEENIAKARERAQDAKQNLSDFKKGRIELAIR